MQDLFELAKKFIVRFDGLRRAHGRYSMTGETDKRGKQKGKPMTLYEKVSEPLWIDHLEGRVGLGIVPINDENNCLWGAIDVDVYDGDIRDIETRLVRFNLPLVVVRSKSGGAHIYAFFKTWIAAEKVRKFLGNCATCLGFPGVEIFPKQTALASKNDVGNWLNMPYFEFDRTMRYAIRNGKALDAEEALEYFAECEIDEMFVENYQPPENKLLEEAPPCLQVLAEQGVREGHRNDTLVNFGVYCKLRWPDDWKNRLNEMNLTFFSPPLGPSEVMTVQKSVGRKDYHYTCKKECIAPYCNRSICFDRKYGIGENDDIGIVIDDLTKLEADPHPIWVAEINGKRIELSIEDMFNQIGFRKKCVEALDIIPKKLSGPKWEKMLQGLLSKARVVEMPEDVGPRGALAYYAEQFCTARSRARHKDGIYSGKAWYDEQTDRVYFKGQHFQEYLWKRGFRDYTSTAVWRILKDIFDGVNVQMKIKGTNTRVWGLRIPGLDKNDPMARVEIPEEEF